MSPARAAEVAELKDRLAEAEARAGMQRAGLEQLRKEREGGGPEVELVRVQVVEPELLTSARGTAAGATLPAILIAGRVRSPGGVKSLTVNGREETLDAQGLFRTRLGMRDPKDQIVRIVAVDRSDRSSTLELSAARRSPVTPARLRPHPPRASRA